MITIVGLGAGDISQISFSAMEILKTSKNIYMRTANHPILEKLEIEYESFDDYYEDGENFEAVYEKIAKKVLEIGRNNDIIYSVPGHPRVAESTVPLIESYARKEGIQVDVIASMSFIDAMYNYLEFDPSEGFRLLDAFDVRLKDLDCDSNIIITQVYDRFIASNIKIKLMEYYEDDQEIYLVRSAGIKGQEFKEKMSLSELDRDKNQFDHLTSLFIAKSNKKRFKDVFDLKDLVRKLRQENEEIKSLEYVDIAEKLGIDSKRLIASVENDNIEEMIESLGEALYDVVLHSQIGIEEGYFDFEEVCDSVCISLSAR
ncbi:MAG: SAM-dependent methyltransferase [Peptostreptococcus sp.]|uniref:SAM-dependent methyltransferase n=1 Tax=Peptostreptococcus sp. TaxID=1262 RepID=UPI002FC8E8AB